MYPAAWRWSQVLVTGGSGGRGTAEAHLAHFLSFPSTCAWPLPLWICPLWMTLPLLLAPAFHCHLSPFTPALSELRSRQPFSVLKSRFTTPLAPALSETHVFSKEQSRKSQVLSLGKLLLVNLQFLIKCRHFIVPIMVLDTYSKCPSTIRVVKVFSKFYEDRIKI